MVQRGKRQGFFSLEQLYVLVFPILVLKHLRLHLRLHQSLRSSRLRLNQRLSSQPRHCQRPGFKPLLVIDAFNPSSPPRNLLLVVSQ